MLLGFARSRRKHKSEVEVGTWKSKRSKYAHMAPGNMNSPILAPQRFWKQQRAAFAIRRRIARKRVKLSLVKLKEEMVEIRKEQQCIKEEQRKVRQKFKIIESECAILRKETELISQKSATTRLHLALVFQILKAREDNDFNKANDLARTLRELIAKQNNTN